MMHCPLNFVFPFDPLAFGSHSYFVLLQKSKHISTENFKIYYSRGQVQEFNYIGIVPTCVRIS